MIDKAIDPEVRVTLKNAMQVKHCFNREGSVCLVGLVTFGEVEMCPVGF